MVTDFDDHGTVTITAAELDGVDILADINTEDDIVFLYKATDLALGEYDVVLTFEDAAGNETEDFEFTFEVILREPFEVAVKPGWNLVSLPGSPSDPAINSVVITADTGVTSVITYDPDATGGPWLTAVRDADGNLVGSLTQMTADRSYWVLSTTFQPIEVDIPRVSGGQQITPPTVTLDVGWNLVPAIDVSGEKSSGDELDTTVAQYLSGIEFSRVYEFDTLAGQFTSVQSTDSFVVGMGYWVYVTEAGVLVP